MNKSDYFYTYMNTVFVNSMKMVKDTKLKFSMYTYISTSYRMVYHTLM